MSAELQEAEEQIDVHDLPNFRFEGATQFDVNQSDSTTLQDASGSFAAILRGFLFLVHHPNRQVWERQVSARVGRILGCVPSGA